MPELNPIVTTLLQLIEAKQQDAALAQRKQEADSQMQFNHEQLSATLEERKLERKRQEAEDAIQHAQLKQASTQEFKNRVMGGTERMQGQLGPDQSIPTSQSGPIQVADISPQNRAGRSFVPFQEQIVPTPVGDVNIPSDSIISYDENLQRKLQEMFMQSQGKAQEAGLTAQAQEAVRQPGRIALEEIKSTKATTLADYAATKAKDLAAINNAAALKRVQTQGATTIGAANIAAVSRITASKNSKQLNPNDVDSLYHNVKFGVENLSGNTDIARAARTQLVKNNEVALSPKAADSIVDIKNLEEIVRLANEILPELGDGFTGSMMNAIKASKPGTKLYDLGGALVAKTPLLSNVFGVKGTQSDRDIANLLQGLWGTFTTSSKLKNNIEKLQAQSNVSMGIQTKGMQNAQRLETIQHFQMDPEMYNSPIIAPNGKPATDRQGNVLQNFKLINGRWGAFNSKTKNWEAVE